MSSPSDGRPPGPGASRSDGVGSWPSAPAAGPYGMPPAGGAPAHGVPYGPGAHPSVAAGPTPARPAPPVDVVSVVGLVLAFLAAPVGLVVSIVGLVRTWGGRRRGRWIAVAGVVVSVVLSLLLAAVVLAVVALRSFADDPSVWTVDGGDGGQARGTPPPAVQEWSAPAGPGAATVRSDP